MRLQRILFAWGGAALLAPLGAAPVRADARADALLKEVARAERSTRTLSADLVMSQSAQGQTIKVTGKVRLKKPNLARIVYGPPLSQTIASDGKTVWALMTASNQYTQQPVDAKGSAIQTFLAVPITLFFDPASLGPLGKVAQAHTRYVGQERIGGQSFQVVELTNSQPFAYKLKLYVGSDRLVRRAALAVPQGKQTTHLTAALSNVRTDLPLATASFAFQPPKTAQAAQESDDASKLIPVGKQAPQFSLPTPTGGHVALAEALKGKKAVLVNFWFAT
jgi:outer membrane lipoprotein-sorting protein